MIDAGTVDVRERQATQACDCVVSADHAGLYVVEQRSEAQFIHVLIVPRGLLAP